MRRPPKDTNSNGGNWKDWNSAWQEALEMPTTPAAAAAAAAAAGTGTGPGAAGRRRVTMRSSAASLSFKRWEALSRLSADFKATAENYARVIVMERHLPDGEKTVKRLSGLEGGGGGDGAGFSLGAAGGEKYLVAGIYFKFCIELFLRLIIKLLLSSKFFF